MARNPQNKKQHRKAVEDYHKSDMHHWHRRIALSMIGYRQEKWNSTTNSWEKGEPNQWLKGVGVGSKEQKNEAV